jgi:hypothetical protein
MPVFRALDDKPLTALYERRGSGVRERLIRAGTAEEAARILERVFAVDVAPQDLELVTPWLPRPSAKPEHRARPRVERSAAN